MHVDDNDHGGAPDRSALIREAVSLMEQPAAPVATEAQQAPESDDEPADDGEAPAHTEPDPEDVIPEAATEPPAAKPDESKIAEVWQQLGEMRSQLREQLAALKEREAALSQQHGVSDEVREAQDLLKKDPIAFAEKFGPKSFYEDMTKRKLNGGSVTPDEQIRSLRDEISSLKQRLEADDHKRILDNFVGETQKHVTSTQDVAVLQDWLEPHEFGPTVLQTARNHMANSKEALTPQDVVSTLHDDLVGRLTRLSKSQAGQQLLRKLLQENTSSKSKAAASAPRTITNDLTTTSSPRKPREAEAPLSRDELIREALKLVV